MHSLLDFLLSSNFSHFKDSTILVTQPGVRSVIIENESCCSFLYFFKVANLFPVCRVPYSIVGLTMDVYAADFTGLVQSFKLRRINPNVLLPLPIVLSMCLSQVRLLEMVTHFMFCFVFIMCYVPNVSCVSELSILDCPFSFL